MAVYTITLPNGKIIDNLVLNGNNFESSTEITAELFDGNLSEVHITASEESNEPSPYPAVLHDAELVQILQPVDTPDGKWWFILREIPEDEATKAKTEKRFSSLEAANDDLVLMMADLIGG